MLGHDGGFTIPVSSMDVALGSALPPNLVACPVAPGPDQRILTNEGYNSGSAPTAFSAITAATTSQAGLGVQSSRNNPNVSCTGSPDS